MPELCYSADTLDDLLRAIFEAILERGREVVASRGDMKELSGVLLEITNPRARLSRTETRGKPFSCLGELLWYLAGSNSLDFIQYYIRQYASEAEGDTIYGGYGPRVFGPPPNQITTIINLLKNKPTSRRAVIQIFDAVDLLSPHIEVPCTCTLQFLIRAGRLELHATMRSNDANKGLAHDVFCFTMIQELVARELLVDLGTYKHFVGSLHLYADDATVATDFLGEGWQTPTQMPLMPSGDPWPAVNTVLEAERQLRVTGTLAPGFLSSLDAYWGDLIRLLRVFRHSKDGDTNGIQSIRQEMVSATYDAFIVSKLK